jgi:hypothetical protein
MNPSSNVCKIDAYPDTDFAGMFGHEDHTDPACAKSRTGFIITFAEYPVFWQYVSIHEDNSGALVLAKTLPPQFTPRSKYYAIKTVWFREEVFKRDVQLLKIDTANNWVISLRKKVSYVLFLNISGRRLWDCNSLDPSLFECTSSSLERECRTRSWGSGYILLVFIGG